ncbi:UDP-glucose 4-epimerase GalE [Amphritea sp. HPY]|uniref:UDP-glucose 4-epimerase GalE n=1 Tax=Amphritea sp. HPY TaxID=3421652 RepID=UPI003D7D714B
MTILVTGGAGYIGSHTVIQLLESGNDVIVLDNLCNANPEVFNRIEKICNRRPAFIEGDVRNAVLLDTIFSNNQIDSVIHFAGLKAVGESVANPVLYYQNNVAGSITLFEVMQQHGCKKVVFSSSATVYGDPASIPVTESSPYAPANPYGTSKMMVENILTDLHISDNNWQVALLRYFNPVGAHPSGLIGEDPKGIPNNLMPFVTQVASGQLEKLSIFGGDYPTQDGTGVRDYIHVQDLARGHLKALEALAENHGCAAYNLGTGVGYSVLDVVNTFMQENQLDIAYQIVERRAGDVAEYYADPSFSSDRLGWKAEHSLKDMVRDHWNWQKNNPEGY